MCIWFSVAAWHLCQALMASRSLENVLSSHPQITRYPGSSLLRAPHSFWQGLVTACQDHFLAGSSPSPHTHPGAGRREIAEESVFPFFRKGLCTHSQTHTLSRAAQARQEW